MDRHSIDQAISKAAASLGYTLKPEQRRSMEKFVSGSDVFVSLPTGFGKSLCYILLPPIFDLLRKVQSKSIVLVVSPLIALMKDQVSSIRGIGLTATLISDKESTPSAIRASIKKGEFQIVFVSPEALFMSTEWRSMLASEIYRENLVGFVIDEAHCIKKWGEKFRTEFSHLDEVRSIIPDTVRVMALTATATKTTRKFIIKSLSMQAPEIVYVPPDKDNILYTVLDKPDDGVDEYFEMIVDKLKVERGNMDRMIIFCKTYNNVIAIYQYFKKQLGDYFTEPTGSKNYVINRVVDMYTHCTHETVKSKIIAQFTKQSPLRIVIATIAFGMGINCHDVRHVIHWGVPSDAEMYVQESGRAGRDGKLACATILKNASDLDQRYTTKHMIEYCGKKTACRRKFLFEDFYGCSFKSEGCKCCDICNESCGCKQCDSNLKPFNY